MSDTNENLTEPPAPSLPLSQAPRTALCAGPDVNPDWWHDHELGMFDKAKDICLDCTLMVRCGEVGKDEYWGIWGGLGPLERNPNRPGRNTLNPGQVPDKLAWRDGFANDHAIYSSIIAVNEIKAWSQMRGCSVQTVYRFMRNYEAEHGLPHHVLHKSPGHRRTHAMSD